MLIIFQFLAQKRLFNLALLLLDLFTRYKYKVVLLKHSNKMSENLVNKTETYHGFQNGQQFGVLLFHLVCRFL